MAGAWTLLASNFGATSASTITVSATLTAGRALHVAVISDDATISSTADTLSNSYTEQGSVIEAAVPRRLHNITSITATGGSTTITVTFAASVANRQIAVYEGTGVSSYDAHGEQTDTGSNPTGNVSATNSAQPASVHAVTIFYQGGTPTVGTGYTDSGVCFSGSGMLIGRGEYKSVSTTGAHTVTVGALRQLHCGARSGVVPKNSLRSLRSLRSNSFGKHANEARCARRPLHCAPRRHISSPI
jgi:hypothetical protein